MIRDVYSGRLFLGNARDARTLRPLEELQIQAIVDLAANEEPARLPRELIYCRIPIVDGEENADGRIAAAIQCVVALARHELRTLVACSAGLSRSPAILAAAIALLTGDSPDQCLAQIVAGAPHDVSPALWASVKSVHAQLSRLGGPGP